MRAAAGAAAPPPIARTGREISASAVLAIGLIMAGGALRRTGRPTRGPDGKRPRHDRPQGGRVPTRPRRRDDRRTARLDEADHDARPDPDGLPPAVADTHATVASPDRSCLTSGPGIRLYRVARREGGRESSSSSVFALPAQPVDFERWLRTGEWRGAAADLLVDRWLLEAFRHVPFTTDSGATLFLPVGGMQPAWRGLGDPLDLDAGADRLRLARTALWRPSGS